MWKFLDELHPLYDPKESAKYMKEVETFFIKIDDFLGEILKVMDNTSNLFIVSDHGFGINDQCFNLAKWLEYKEYLVREKRKILQDTLKNIVYWGGSLVSKIVRLEKILNPDIVEKISKQISPDITNIVDLKKSKAFDLGHTIPFGGIYINSCEKYLHGIVKYRDYHTLKEKIIQDLNNLNEDLEEDSVVKIFDPKKIYYGDKINLAPDIIFAINDWRCTIIKDVRKNFLFKNTPYSDRHSGSHRMDGIFVGYGAQIKEGFEIKDINILNITPTILHMLEVPIPSEIKGRILKKIFKEDSDPYKRTVLYKKVRSEKEKIREKISKLSLR